MVSIAAWFWVSCYLFAGVTLPVVIFMALVFPKRLVQFVEWLKGSRITYYLPFDARGRNSVEVKSTTEKLRTRKQSSLEHNPEGAVIEVSRGFFRRWSAVHNSGANAEPIVYWQVAQNWRNRDGNIVCLEDTGGLSVETALRTINKYQSLQAVLDEIDLIAGFKERLQYMSQENYDLACKLGLAEKTNKEWAAAVKAVIEKMLDQKYRRKSNQRFRSKNAEEIRKNLEKVLSDQEVTTFDSDLVEQYTCLFEGREYWPADR